MNVDLNKASEKKHVYGIAGIRDHYGCSDSTALRIKKSGVIDDAITQQGKTIVVDAETRVWAIILNLYRQWTIKRFIIASRSQMIN